MAVAQAQPDIIVRVQPLTAEAFAPYGRVVEPDQRQPLHMKEGQYTARLMTVESLPDRVTRINRHMDHSQMFVPLGGDPFVVVVAPPDEPGQGFDASTVVAFATNGRQTVIFDAGTWHIEPRSLEKPSCQVINVQTDVSPKHTELISIEEECGVAVAVRV